MREHLYHGKRVDNGEWVEGFYWNRGQLSHYIKVIDDNGNLVGDYEVLPETVGEYTGLTDKNGSKIFEGYILRAIGDYEIQGVVEWQKNECRYLVQLLGNDDWVTMEDYEWEIIGNIHENPELLEGK